VHDVARLALLSGHRQFGGLVWTDAIAAQSVQTQHADGSWGSPRRTCLNVLALCAARTPVLINKLRFGEGDDWNRDPRDAANVTRWFGRQTDTAFTWQVVDLHEDLAGLDDAPILLVTGHEAPILDESAQARLRAYVNRGGTILAVACCSSEAFVEGCRALFEGVFPRDKFDVLTDDHPVWTLHDPVRPGEDCLGLGDTCRTGVFLLTAGSCCAWQQNLIHDEARHFALAGNIFRYATFGQALRSRLPRPSAPVAPLPLATVVVARLRHGGDWWADPDSLVCLSSGLTAHMGLGVDERPALSPDEVRGADVDALWVTGRTFEAPPEPDHAALKEYLLSGGTLIGSALCGEEAFDRSFRAFGAALFGPFAWEVVPPDDPILTGAVAPGLGSSLTLVSYRPRFEGPPRALVERPLLRGIRHDERWLVLYSPVDINGGTARQPCLDCVGYPVRHSEAIAGNVLLYVASQAAAKP
jgi:hypothetical protein